MMTQRRAHFMHSYPSFLDHTDGYSTGRVLFGCKPVVQRPTGTTALLFSCVRRASFFRIHVALSRSVSSSCFSRRDVPWLSPSSVHNVALATKSRMSGGQDDPLPVPSISISRSATAWPCGSAACRCRRSSAPTANCCRIRERLRCAGMVCERWVKLTDGIPGEAGSIPTAPWCGIGLSRRQDRGATKKPRRCTRRG